MTADNIKEAAMYFFATYGYEGTSLSQIAKEAGIKKQSIYSHFKGKDDLFLHILNNTLDQEIRDLNNNIKELHNKPLKTILYQVLENLMERYEHNENVKFWLRVSFYPPAHLYEEVNTAIYEYDLEERKVFQPLFIKAMENKMLKKRDPEQAVIAFISLLNAITVELVYGGINRAKEVVDPSWEVFWDGISLTGKGEG
jgi:AcrR family transcriptional regulator